MKIVMIEHYKELDFVDADSYQGLYIALTPMVMEELKNRNIPFISFDEYGVWQENEKYIEGMQEWFTELTEFTSKYIPQKIDMRHFVGIFKGMIDSLTRRWYQFDQFMKLSSPDEVIYVVSRNHIIDKIDDNLWFDGCSLTYTIAKYFFDANIVFVDGVPFKSVKNWRDNSVIRWLYDYMRYCQFVPSWRFKKVTFASPMKAVREARLGGYIVDVLKDRPIDYEAIDVELQYNDLFRSICNFSGLPYVVCSFLLKSRFDYFFKSFLPRVLAYKSYYTKKFLFDGVNKVVFTRRNKAYMYGVLLACNTWDIESVYIRHGWDAYHSWPNEWKRLLFFKKFVVDNYTDVVYFNKLNYDCRVGKL